MACAGAVRSALAEHTAPHRLESASQVGASQPGSRRSPRVLLLEKGDRLARKLVISGGGRCNVTNRKTLDALIAEIPGNGRFLRDAFARFGNEDIIRFFEGLGVALKEEDHGRMFPVSDRATTVAETLVSYLVTHGVEIRRSAPVEELDIRDGRIVAVRLRGGECLVARAVVVAVGGKSVPKTGSTGDGYAWARAAGHTITELFPTEVPLISDAPWILDRSLQGLSLRETALTLKDGKGKRLTTQRGDLVFTHFGLSGPAALRLGHYVSVALRHDKGPLTAQVDFLPDFTEEAVRSSIEGLAAAEPKKAVKNVLKGLLPERAVALLLETVALSPETTHDHLPRAPMRELAHLIKAWPVPITGTRPLEEAFVTGGGVSLKEVDPRTMASRKVEGLFFAGEILDVHAHTGGYNITIAFSTGHVAGSSAASAARDQ